MSKNATYATDEKVNKFILDFQDVIEEDHDRFLTDNYIDAFYCARKNGFECCEDCPQASTCKLYSDAMREYMEMEGGEYEQNNRRYRKDYYDTRKSNKGRAPVHTIRVS